MNEDGQVSISRRGLLAVGLTAAVVGSIGVVSMINAAADDNADTPVAVAAADSSDAPATDAPEADAPAVVPPPSTRLPWGERPHRMRVGRFGASSASLTAAGASGAKDDTSVQPTAEFGPKGHTTRSGALTTQETNVEPPPVPPGLAPEPTPDQKVVYTYAQGRQVGDLSGAAANLTIASPKVQPGDWHSLAEIAVQSLDGQQVIEVGWTVDRLVNDGSDDPHLFVFNWIDGGPQCYNGCGYIPAKGASIKPGDTLPLGFKNFGIQHIGDGWWIAYDTEWIGMFPDSNWKGGYTRAGQVQYYGEVASSDPTTCTQMGNGNSPETSAAARFGSVVYVDGPPVNLAVRSTNESLYSTNRLNDRTFRYGGSPDPKLCAPKN
jgi:hypothetical protein